MAFHTHDFLKRFSYSFHATLLIELYLNDENVTIVLMQMCVNCITVHKSSLSVYYTAKCGNFQGEIIVGFFP